MLRKRLISFDFNDTCSCLFYQASIAQSFKEGWVATYAAHVDVGLNYIPGISQSAPGVIPSDPTRGEPLWTFPLPSPLTGEGWVRVNPPPSPSRSKTLRGRIPPARGGGIYLLPLHLAASLCLTNEAVS